MFSRYKSMGVIDPQGVAILDSSGLIGRVRVATQYRFQNSLTFH